MSATWVLLSSPGSGCKSNMWTHIISRTQISKILTSKGVYWSSALTWWPELTDYFVCLFKKKYFMSTKKSCTQDLLEDVLAKTSPQETGLT